MNLDDIGRVVGRILYGARLVELAVEASDPAVKADYLDRARAVLRPILAVLPADLRQIARETLKA